MDEGLVAPCLELGRAEHDALRYMTRKTNRKGVVPLKREWLASRLQREIFNWGVTSASAVITHLEDGGCILKLDGYGYEVLRPCDCDAPRKKVGEDSPTGCAPATAGHIIARSAEICSPPSGLSERGQRRGGYKELEFNSSTSRSVRRSNTRSPVPGLVSAFFFTATQYGLMHSFETNRSGLGKHVKIWLADGLPPDMVREMIKEFVRHPEWMKRARSQRSAWEVFVSRRFELIRIINNRPTRDKDWLRNDPSPTRHKDWLGRHTPTSYSVP